MTFRFLLHFFDLLLFHTTDVKLKFQLAYMPVEEAEKKKKKKKIIA